jgi:CHASE3 domain sensor protein
MAEYANRAEKELMELLSELDQLVKHPELGGLLNDRAINASLVLVVVDGLRAYLRGQKLEAAEEFLTAGEEIKARALGHKASLS